MHNQLQTPIHTPTTPHAPHIPPKTDKQATTPLTYTWECARADGRPCFGAAGRGNIAGHVWIVPAGVLTSEIEHTFTVTVSKGGW
jgi:hypothetical protein